MDIKRDAPQVVQVIYSQTAIAGKGVLLDPVRRVIQIHSIGGELIVEGDPYRVFTMQDVFSICDAVLPKDVSREAIQRSLLEHTEAKRTA